ncbi:hypothetical protein [Phormidium tenue]|uniref:Uncharacterized protein n=1 Tax=Phormidium tenue NIES-30 TaxID=549789 RepID=A0A1U7J207_9CYAN|nr:hypothetical protein [Phormidium tenue]MBD2233703.1 hypothetical protein [Phormidium tenue FACHB-1052]OKH46121.1 hypothetical protein NIES30_17645 [Phormidium tenue NIES-30]
MANDAARHSATPPGRGDPLDWDESAIALFAPLLEELLNDDLQPEPQPQLNLLQSLVEVAKDLDDICARLSGRPLTVSQMKALAGIEMLSGSLSAKTDDFVALFQD